MNSQKFFLPRVSNVSLELKPYKNCISGIITTEYPYGLQLSTHTFSVDETNLNFCFFQIQNKLNGYVSIRDFYYYLLKCEVYVNYDVDEHNPNTNCSSKVVFHVKQNIDSPAYSFNAIRRVIFKEKQNNEPIKVELPEPSVSSSSSSSSESCKLFDILSSSSSNSSIENNDDVCEAIYGLHLSMHDMLKEQHNTTCQITKMIATINKHVKQTQQSNKTSLFNK